MELLSTDDPSVRENLGRVVRNLTCDPTFQDDLIQEAMIHFWLMETRRPKQTRSWYLQSCKYHLRHYLLSGRSIDSPKRRAGQVTHDSDRDGHDTWPWLSDGGDSVVADVSVRDLISQLSPHLLPSEKAVLAELADGLGAREIGRKLRVSHTLVIKQRRKIAALLLRLEPSCRPRCRSTLRGTASQSNGQAFMPSSASIRHTPTPLLVLFNPTPTPAAPPPA